MVLINLPDSSAVIEERLGATEGVAPINSGTTRHAMGSANVNGINVLSDKVTAFKPKIILMVAL